MRLKINNVFFLLHFMSIFCPFNDDDILFCKLVQCLLVVVGFFCTTFLKYSLQ